MSSNPHTEASSVIALSFDREQLIQLRDAANAALKGDQADWDLSYWNVRFSLALHAAGGRITGSVSGRGMDIRPRVPDYSAQHRMLYGDKPVDDR